ncbi:hypothetical protein AB1484_27325 [Parafrankia sp. FMc6]|uniref:hypothetical protein n=1 Tax=Parafrankia soli TaxID=2599596 RepID=UPI0034D78906
MTADDRAAVAELAADVERRAVLDPAEHGYTTAGMARLCRAVPALLDALATAERERDQALAALARIELDKVATAEQCVVVAAHGSLASGQLTDSQIIAAAARHTIGGDSRG